MNVDAKVLAELNRNIALDLIAVNQYILHARVLKHHGFASLGKTIYKRSVAVMKECDEIIERVLLLSGNPDLQNLGALKIGHNAEEILRCDLDLETRRRAALQKAAAVCEEHRDFISRELSAKFLDASEDYGDWLETQLDLISELGLENYLQSAV